MITENIINNYYHCYYFNSFKNIRILFKMSINNITYLDQIIPNRMFCFTNSLNTEFLFCDFIEVTKFLNTLEHNQAYVVTFDFIYSILMYNEDVPTINLSKPILITKNSNPETISIFLKERVILACNIHYLDESNLDNQLDGISVIVNYSKINLF